MHEPGISRRAVAATIPLALTASATAALSVSSAADPVLAQIELHKALVVRANTHPGDDDDPGFQTACSDEEAALQALGDMRPTTVAGAAAQLQYMADVEACFANDGSPLLRTVLTVTKALIGGLPA